jgi:hypothetical protein
MNPLVFLAANTARPARGRLGRRLLLGLRGRRAR